MFLWLTAFNPYKSLLYNTLSPMNKQIMGDIFVHPSIENLIISNISSRQQYYTNFRCVFGKKNQFRSHLVENRSYELLMNNFHWRGIPCQYRNPIVRNGSLTPILQFHYIHQKQCRVAKPKMLVKRFYRFSPDWKHFEFCFVLFIWPLIVSECMIKTVQTQPNFAYTK